MQRTIAAVALTGVAFLVPTLVGAGAVAGPCSDDIAALGRKFAESPSLGPATTGALAGSGPGTVKTATTSATPDLAGTSADKAMGGTGGTKEMNAAASQVATSAEDVRRQQEGLPTAAQAASQNAGAATETTPKQGDAAQPDDRMSAAKMELEKARSLDARNDASCADAVKRARTVSGS